MNDSIELYSSDLSSGLKLVVMPIPRILLDDPVTYPSGITFYPPGYLVINDFRVVPNKFEGDSMAETISAITGVTDEAFKQHSLVVFPFDISWNTVLIGNHKAHIKLIKDLSEHVEKTLEVIRFHFCRMSMVDTLPGKAGTVDSNPAFSAALLYNLDDHESYIIAGSVFSHVIVKGVGLELEPLTTDDFPQESEVGKIIQHGFELHSRVLEANSDTAKFIQIMNLFEYLAYPDGYKKFTDVAKIIARYVADNSKEYKTLKDRFDELTGKRDETNKFVGYRTRIVHLGERLYDILPNENDIKKLFNELDRYVGIVLSHMLKYSYKTWDEYLEIRRTIQPYNST